MWPTPRASDGEKGGPNQRGSKGDLMLSSAVHHFPTPTATNTKANHMRGADKGKPRGPRSYSLTPRATDIGKGEGSETFIKRMGDRSEDCFQSLPSQVGGQLNPPWVEWLMGWPIGWTDLRPLGMDKFQQWLRSHGEP